jgi:hypothetical protein
MPISAEALIQQILAPALPVAATPSTPSPAHVRETASVLIGRILNPSEPSPEPRRSPDR